MLKTKFGLFSNQEDQGSRGVVVKMRQTKGMGVNSFVTTIFNP